MCKIIVSTFMTLDGIGQTPVVSARPSTAAGRYGTSTTRPSRRRRNRCWPPTHFCSAAAHTRF